MQSNFKQTLGNQSRMQWICQQMLLVCQDEKKKKLIFLVLHFESHIEFLIPDDEDLKKIKHLHNLMREDQTPYGQTTG